MAKELIWKPVSPPAAKSKKESFKELSKISQFIYQLGESDILRKKAIAVSPKHIIAYTTQEKLKYLKRCLIRFRRITKGKGRGIASVQVGIQEAFFLIYFPTKRKKYQFFINPKITKVSKELYSYKESCMSCNGLIAPVVRPAWVEMEYFDEDGEEQAWSTKDETREGKMYNRVIQHEIDHLHGIINIDRVQSKELVFESGHTDYEKPTFEKAKKS
jgi:peptide deformylase